MPSARPNTPGETQNASSHSPFPAGGGAGAGGQGGGTLFGGFSSGVAGGSAEFFGSHTEPVVNTEGGKGGDVTQNSLSSSHTTLTGARGGDGGLPDDEGGGGIGDGGHGGGSAFGGVSAGVAGGYSRVYIPDITAVSNGGQGGRVAGNTVTLTSTELIGGDGGNSGQVTEFNLGGGGSGGNGGGSVFGGLSTGGSGGYQTSHSPTPDGANGGNGGEVTGNTLALTDITLTGADGGDAGGASTLLSDSAGSGGHGGGSVFGGLSNGGVGGMSEFGDASGGNGGTLSDHAITLTDVGFARGDLQLRTIQLAIA